MPKLGLDLTVDSSVTEMSSLLTLCENNFTRLQNIFDTILDVDGGAISFAVSIGFATALSRLDGVIASFSSGLNGSTAYVSASVLNNQVILQLWDSSFNPSPAGAFSGISWIAWGERSLA